MKFKTVYICEQCGHESPKWVGKCPSCDAWNSFLEDVVTKESTREQRSVRNVPSPLALMKANSDESRLRTGIQEFDRVTGGGIVPGSLILLSGEPGIGKSTLTLMICQHAASKVKSVLYVSGEESPSQIASRAKRLRLKNENVHILGETNLENIMAVVEKDAPGLMIIDSIQVMSSDMIPSIAGSINQTRYCAETLMEFAKKNNVPVIIIGHVTKDGNLAGPKILEHLVDAVLLIEGEQYQNLRVLRGLKNRFGSTNEVGLFEMTDEGMREVKNASELFLEGRKKGSFGSAITVTMEGTRPLLLEVQALTNPTPFGYPKRAASGFDVNRLQLLLAVIQKHLQMNLSTQDVYVNVVGGLKLNDPAADLAIAMAVMSSLQKKALPFQAVYIGEIGLAGELRAVTHLEKRITEAKKLGFTQIHASANRRTKEGTEGTFWEDLQTLAKNT